MSAFSLNNREAIALFLVHDLGQAQVCVQDMAALLEWDEKSMSKLVKFLVSKKFLAVQGQGMFVVHQERIPACDIADRLKKLMASDDPLFLDVLCSRYMEHSLSGQHLESMFALLEVLRALTIKNNYKTLPIVCDWLLRKILAFRTAGSPIRPWQNLIELCLEMHPFTLPYFELGRRTVLVLYKARGMAFATGDIRALASLDIILGTEVTRRVSRSDSFRLRNAGSRGKQTMATLSDWDLQTRLALYLGILEYDTGCYQNAVGHLSLCGQMESSPAQRILGEVSQLYHAQCASLLGNFTLATNMFRSLVRRASTHNSHQSLNMLNLQLALCLLAQGDTEESLELVDSVMSCVCSKSDTILWMCACACLAYYHRMSGHPERGYIVFCQCMARAEEIKFSYIMYHLPFFMELLFTWHEAGLPGIAGCHFEQELKYRLEGRNEMLRAVALRLKGQLLLRGQNPTGRQEAVRCLEESLSIARETGIARERAKVCVLLAKVHMEENRRQAGLALAMEAWSLSPMLRQVPWMEILAGLVPAPASLEPGGATLSSDEFFDSFSISFMEEQPATLQDFYQLIVKIACSVFGSARACLLCGHVNSGRIVLLASLRMTEAEINSRSFLPQAALVEKSMAGSPVFTAISKEQTQGASLLPVICIPLLGKDGERLVLYLEGDIFPHLANILTQETLLYLSRILAWEFVRFERRRPAQAKPANYSGAGTAEETSTLIYQSRAMAVFLEQADNAARSDAAILLYGETGTGKELIARRIHAVSGRKGPLVAVNLSSMPEELFENEMLGHELGAFTGAMQRKSGLIELADNGTLFIDEMPDISQRVQIKLLRLLQEKAFSRLGGTSQIHSDFRLIVATNRDIREDVRMGRFREDLFYRISVIPLTVPPLRQRREDILPIIRHYVQLLNRRYNKQCAADLGHESLDKLMAHTWPGNVRELKNLVEQSIILAKGGDLILHWPEQNLTPGFGFEGPASCVQSSSVQEGGPKAEAEQVFFSVARPRPVAKNSAVAMLSEYYARLPSLKDVEEQYIQAIMTLTDGKIDGDLGAAKILGLKRSALYYRLDKLIRH